MKNIPEKCTRCGAPISWEEGASVLKCEYCGYKNNLKDDFRSLFKNYLKLRDLKKIIKNPISLVFLLPIIFLSLLINSPTKKQESIKAEFWPKNWDKLKQVKVKNIKNFGKNVPSNWDKSFKELMTVRFKKNLQEACEYTKLLTKDQELYDLTEEKILYEFNIFMGYTPEFGLSIPLELYADTRSVDARGIKSSYKNRETFNYDKQKTINRLNKISKFLKENTNTYLDYFDYYEKQYNSLYSNQIKEVSKLSSDNYHKLTASYYEVMRQAGDKNWKITNRWAFGINGIGDLRRFYKEKYKNSREYKNLSEIKKNSWDEGKFKEWLLNKRVLKESDFRIVKNDSGVIKFMSFKHNAYNLINKAKSICNIPTRSF